jgi:hypothetical protein
MMITTMTRGSYGSEDLLIDLRVRFGVANRDGDGWYGFTCRHDHARRGVRHAVNPLPGE